MSIRTFNYSLQPTFLDSIFRRAALVSQTHKACCTVHVGVPERRLEVESEPSSREGRGEGEISGQEEGGPRTADRPCDGKVPDEGIGFTALESEVGESSLFHALNEESTFLINQVNTYPLDFIEYIDIGV